MERRSKTAPVPRIEAGHFYQVRCPHAGYAVRLGMVWLRQLAAWLARWLQS